MVDYPYTTVPGKIKAILAKIRDVGVPAKATANWLKTVGFTSSNDSTLLPILRYIDLIDAQNVPTPRWKSYRGGDHKKILAEAIRTGYSELFGVYPDANSRSQADVENVFKTSSTAGLQAISKTVSTFKALCEEADFGNVGVISEQVLHANHLHAPITASAPEQSHHPTSRGSSSPSLHIDIQIHIAPEASPEQIDQIFQSMAKHLYAQAK